MFPLHMLGSTFVPWFAGQRDEERPSVQVRRLGEGEIGGRCKTLSTHPRSEVELFFFFHLVAVAANLDADFGFVHRLI